jgi:hypothetical protein
MYPTIGWVTPSTFVIALQSADTAWPDNFVRFELSRHCVVNHSNEIGGDMWVGSGSGLAPLGFALFYFGQFVVLWSSSAKKFVPILLFLVIA